MKTKRKVFLMALPGLLMFGFFLVFPFLSSARYSVLNDVFHKEFVGLANFKRVLSNKFFRLAFRNSFTFAVIGISLLVLFSTMLALAVHQLGSGTVLLRILLVVPVLLPTAAIAMSWRSVFKQMYYYDLMKDPVFGSFWYILPIYLMYLWKNIGLCMIVLLAALDKIPTEYYEAAKLDGATRGQCSRKISLPILRPNLLIVLLYGFLSALRIFKESYMFYDSTNYPRDIAYTLQYYMNNHFQKMNYPTLSVASLLFTLVIGIVIALLYRVENRLSGEMM